jgi:hypothetical protein
MKIQLQILLLSSIEILQIMRTNNYKNKLVKSKINLLVKLKSSIITMVIKIKVKFQVKYQYSTK